MPKIPRNHGLNSQRKCKMQKAVNPKHPGNPGHNEKAKPIGIDESEGPTT